MMRSAEDILDYIDRLYAWILERPEMYAHDAVALELVFSYLENLREFVLNESIDNAVWIGPRRFTEFRGRQENQAKMFTLHLRDEAAAHGKTLTRQEEFQALTNLFRKYLRETRPDLNPDDPALLNREFPMQ